MEADWRKYLDMATGLADVPRRKAEDVVKALVARGEIAANASENMVEGLLGQVERNRKTIQEVVTREVERVLASMDVVRRSATEALESRISLLERLRGGGSDESPTSSSTPSASPGKKTAKKTAAKSTAKKAAKKAPSKKAPSKKTGATKATKKATAKKATPKKATAKKSAAKTTAKKAAPPAAGDS